MPDAGSDKEARSPGVLLAFLPQGSVTGMVTDLRQLIAAEVETAPAYTALAPHFLIHTTVQGLDGVGGDMVDVRRITDDVAGMTLADITGHGCEAAPHAAQVREVLAGLDESSRNAPAWLDRLNDRLCQRLDDEHFCATISARLEWLTGEDRLAVSLTNAGMPAPVVYRAARGRVDRVAQFAPPLGAFPESDFLPEPVATTLAPGDLLILCSDGVTEARGSGGGLFGAHRLERVVATLGRTGGQRVLDGLTSALHRFVQPAGFRDDVSIVVIEPAAASTQADWSAAA